MTIASLSLQPTHKSSIRLASIAKALQEDVCALPPFSFEETNASAMALDAMSPALNAVRKYTLESVDSEAQLCLL
jgi:hypothetical protein